MGYPADMSVGRDSHHPLAILTRVFHSDGRMVTCPRFRHLHRSSWYHRVSSCFVSSQVTHLGICELSANVPQVGLDDCFRVQFLNPARSCRR